MRYRLFIWSLRIADIFLDLAIWLDPERRMRKNLERQRAGIVGHDL
jgi:hypothetical protein